MEAVPQQALPAQQVPQPATEAPAANGDALLDGKELGKSMTEDEIALYDRQIRLWGMKAQEKIRSAHVLLITVRALGNEIAKNLVLAGIGSLTLVDHETVTEADLGSQFLLAPGANDAGGASLSDNATDAEREAAATARQAAIVGTNRARAASAQLRLLNPRVNIVVDESNIHTKGPAFYEPFSLIIATDLDPDSLNVINTVTRLVNRPFYASNTYGYFGYIFADLIEHDFVIERNRGNIPTQKGTMETPTRMVLDVQMQSTDASSNGGDAKTNSSGNSNSNGNGNGNGNGNNANSGEKEAVTKRELYSTWFLASDAARLPAAFMTSRRRMRGVTPVLPCLRALWEFQQTHENNRVPNMASEADMTAFIGLVNQKQQHLGTPEVTAEHIRSFLQGVVAGSEISATATILGGELAQDVINVLGHTQQPIQNLLIFDGASIMAVTYSLHPEGPLGRQLLTATASTATATDPAAAAAAAAAAANATATATNNATIPPEAAVASHVDAGQVPMMQPIPIVHGQAPSANAPSGGQFVPQQ